MTVQYNCYLVAIRWAAWLGPHRPSKPRPAIPVLPTGFLLQQTQKIYITFSFHIMEIVILAMLVGDESAFRKLKLTRSWRYCNCRKPSGNIWRLTQSLLRHDLHFITGHYVIELSLIFLFSWQYRCEKKTHLTKNCDRTFFKSILRSEKLKSLIEIDNVSTLP